eukprot:TRINITY_DN33003_c0_g1_i1.p1 TRINITY_DN33003_c0_g1~~TRINITY_DN33003_c0_g1_i1.p1  ORF type:complete len:891 (-),score=140.13 TRINITY_DN33003_c0_g1_i1:92-2764(-)
MQQDEGSASPTSVLKTKRGIERHLADSPLPESLRVLGNQANESQTADHLPKRQCTSAPSPWLPVLPALADAPFHYANPATAPFHYGDPATAGGRLSEQMFFEARGPTMPDGQQDRPQNQDASFRHHFMDAGTVGARIPEQWLFENRGSAMPEGQQECCHAQDAPGDDGSLNALGVSVVDGDSSGGAAASSSSTAASSDWHVVLHHDQNIVVYNPRERPHLRSRRVSFEDSAGGASHGTSAALGRCPLCKQTIDARFAYAAQAYFDLLQSVYRNSKSSSNMEPSEEVDLLSESDLYRILGISRSAQPDDIKRAYRKRSLRYHPDKNQCDPDAKLKFQKIAEAFTVLSDENKRSKYDASGDMDLEDFDVEQFINMVNAAGFKYQQAAATIDVDADDVDMDHLPPGVCKWEVVHFTFVNVRNAKSRLTKILGAKASGSFVYGKEEDGWVKLSDEPGYMMISNEDQGTLLRKVVYADVAEPVGDRTVDSNPFLLPAFSEGPEGVEMLAAVASEGGAEAEAAAAAALRNLPQHLLNTGYYARFFVEEHSLGSGSFGQVFLCRHVLDDLTLGDYAVKKVAVGDNKAWLRDMIREVKTFERLHHPNIVEYKHSWLELSRRSEFCPFVPFLFILMQYCNGGSLDELIWHDGCPSKPKDPLPIRHIWHFLLDILLGLVHLHRQGILHRDLKPTNILMQWPDDVVGGKGGNRTGPPTALLSDFGTAAPFGEKPTAAIPQGYTGTMEYTAPELLTGQGARQEYTEKSDMWSLGIVLYAMCFFTLPFQNDDPHKLKSMICSFVEQRMSGLDIGASLLGGGGLAEAAAAWLPPDIRGAQARLRGGRLGPLRLVLAALLSCDAGRRPAANDLLENPIFRGQVMRNVRRAGDQVLPVDEVIDLTS